jgi:type VI secretion system protein ImpA
MVDLNAWLASTEELPPCGPNLEHDLAFFELEEAARWKPEQRIGDAVKPREDPDWPKVASLAQRLLARTKDLRISVHLTRALTRTEGIPGLTGGLALIRGLLDRYWDQVYPVLDAELGGDPTERLNALSPLSSVPRVDRSEPDTVLEDLRDCYLVDSREHGQMRAREVEVALRRLVPPRIAGEGAPKSLAEIHSQLTAAFATDRAVPTALREARDHVKAIEALVVDRVGATYPFDLKPLVQSLESLLEACDTATGHQEQRAAGGESVVGQAQNGTRSGMQGEIGTREEAVRVLDLVCAYLEHHEPSNPAPLFIRRAQRLMAKNFVEIVKDLMPDSLSNLEKLAGEAIEKEKKK